MRRESPAGACYPPDQKGASYRQTPSILEEAGNIPGNDRPMSGLGQKRKWRHFQNMSAVPPTTDIRRGERHVCFVPATDIAPPHSIT